MSLHAPDSNEDPRIQLNFNITMMDLPCEYATVDVYSSIGFQKNVTKNVRKFPVSGDGVLQRFEQRNWHQNDVELWDPAVFESIDDLHEDGEDAISLNVNSFKYGRLSRAVCSCKRISHSSELTESTIKLSILPKQQFFFLRTQL